MDDPLIVGMVVGIMILIVIAINIGVVSIFYNKVLKGISNNEKRIKGEEDKLRESQEEFRKYLEKGEFRGERLNKKEELMEIRVVSGEGVKNRIHTNKIKANTMLVPENLSEGEKALIKEFYNL